MLYCTFSAQNCMLFFSNYFIFPSLILFCCTFWLWKKNPKDSWVMCWCLDSRVNLLVYSKLRSTFCRQRMCDSVFLLFLFCSQNCMYLYFSRLFRPYIINVIIVIVKYKSMILFIDSYILYLLSGFFLLLSTCI